MTCPPAASESTSIFSPAFSLHQFLLSSAGSFLHHVIPIPGSLPLQRFDNNTSHHLASYLNTKRSISAACAWLIAASVASTKL